MRVVSLLPSATEIVYALGLEDDLVGVTFECDWPPSARTAHRVVVTGLDTGTMSPGEIDDLVRARVAAGDGLYRLDTAALRDLEPDLVLTQDLCRVCALPSEDAVVALRRVGNPSRVLTLDPRRLGEVLDTVLAVAVAAGTSARGVAVVNTLRARLDAIAAATAGLPAPRVLVREWPDPPFVAGHWVPDLVTAAGGTAVLASPGSRSMSTTWDVVRSAGCDMVLVAPCGFGLDAAEREARAVLDLLPDGAAVWAIDSGGYVVRPGPRVVDGVEALAWALHGEAIAPPRDGIMSRIR